MDSHLSAFASFAFVTSVTPGPNNLMLMASGANFGIGRSLPHWMGVSIGTAAVVYAGGIGAGAIISGNPWVETCLRLACVAILGWLGWKIATATRPREGGGGGVPLPMVQAMLFQWVNPKVWAMALAATPLYLRDATAWQVGAYALLLGCINLPATGVWLFFGERLGQVLANERRFRAFSIVMALLLLGSTAPMLAGPG